MDPSASRARSSEVALCRHLVDSGRVPREVADACLRELGASWSGASLSELLIARGLVTEAQLRSAFEELLAATVAEGPPGPAHLSHAASSPSVDVAPDPRGLRLGRYVLGDELGRGGMGVVYRGVDPALRRPVAIKVVGDGPMDETRRRRFIREARAAARLRHPGIVAVHEAGEQDGRLFLVMDLVEGESLADVLDRDTLPPRRAATIVRDVARALDYAHAAGVVHRDVKPGNILLEGDEAAEEGRPLLADFGLATDADAGATAEQLTRTGQLLGTPAFMAPEQLGSGADPVGPPADVYALGGVLYRALAGRAPFEAPDVLALIVQVMRSDAAPLRAVNAAVHVDLETIAARCLEKAPERRYASAAALADDLDRFLAGEPIAARPVGRRERAVRWLRRNPVSAALLLVVAAALGAAGLVGGWAVYEVRARVGEERARFLEETRATARRTAAAFETERATRVPESAVERRRRTDRVLAAGIDALGAAMTRWAAEPDEETATRDALAAAMATGEVALAAEQWSLAAGAFEKALSLGLDEARVREAAARVETERQRVDREHRDAVVAVLDAARRGETADAPSHEDALFRLVRYPEPQTVALLAEALDETTSALWDAIVEAYRTVQIPTEGERRAGEQPIEGLEDALVRWRSAALGDVPDPDAVPLIEAASRRLLARETRRRTPDARRRVLELEDLLASLQERAVGVEQLALARLASQALGRLGIVEGALPPLARYLHAERDAERAAAPAVALCRLGAEGRELVRAVASIRFGYEGPFWRRVARHFDDAPVAAGAPAPGAPPIARTGAPGDRRVKELVASGLVRWSRGDHAGAIAAYDEAIALDPNDAEAFVNRGSARAALGDLDGAVADFTRGVALEPGSALAWSNRGLALREKGDLDGALRDLDRAVVLCGGDDAGVLARRSMIRLDRGDVDGALEDAEAAIARDPRDVVARGQRAKVRRQRGELDAAIADLAEAVAIDPGHIGSWLDLGLLRMDAGDLDGALSDLNRAVELDPRRAPAHVARGTVRKAKGDHDGAFADLTRAIELDPSHPSPRTELGVLYRERGEPRRAITELNAAIELDPTDPAGYANRSTARLDLGDHDGAYADASRAIELRPGLAAAWCNRGNALRAKGDAPAALADLNKALALDPRLPAAWANRGNVLGILGRHQEALADFTRALDLDPSLVRVWLSRAAIKGGVKDYAGAIADASRSIELDPSFAEAWFVRGVSRRLAGDPEGAGDDLARFVAMAPDDAQAPLARKVLRELGR